MLEIYSADGLEMEAGTVPKNVLIQKAGILTDAQKKAVAEGTKGHVAVSLAES